MSAAITLTEKGLVPDPLVRWGIRRLLHQRLAEQRRLGPPSNAVRAFVEEMRRAPVALHTDAANEQHYEVPAEFFQAALGRHLKYSSAWWDETTPDLDAAEARMLAITAERAGLADGQRILELGCGWGSLSLWMAEHYPQATIVSVSNSASQRRYITAQAEDRGLRNLEVRTADINEFEPHATFDRVVSVEMFEHVRNWEALLGRVEGWLAPGGRLFLHVFAHREYAYPFETEGASNWMGRYFFTGGMMPSHDLPEQIDSGFEVEQSWVVDGTHYARTAEAWLDNTDRRRRQLLPVLEATYGVRDAAVWFRRWRLFFLACAELFAWDSGKEWHVSHHLLKRRGE
jgi:cyclopropane-fatty-acyl-phospholipid synthase